MDRAAIAGQAAGRETQVYAQVSELRSDLKALHAIINELHNRLAPVSVQEPPKPDKQDSPVRPALVQLADDLYVQRMMVKAATESIGGLLKRLEL